MNNPKHVLRYFTQFTFKLTINGDKVLPGAWWPTKTAASFYAELSKWYYRSAFGLDHHTVRRSDAFTSESLIVEAKYRGIDLTSNTADVFQYLPKGIQSHITRFKGELDAMALMNLDTGYQRAVAAVLKNLRSAASACSHAREKTTGAKQEYMNLAMDVFARYAIEFEASAIVAANSPEFKPV